MYLKSKILSIGHADGYVLVQGATVAGLSSDDFRDTRHARVALIRFGEAPEVDLTAACTVLRPASKKVSRYLSDLAKGQREMADSSGQGKHERARYAQNEQQFAYKAKLAGRDNLWLPSRIEGADTAKILVGIWGAESGSPKHVAALRLVDAHTADVVFEHEFTSRHDITAVRSLTGFLAFSQCGTRMLCFALARDAAGLTVEERRIEQGLPTTGAAAPLPFGSSVVSTPTHWLAAVDGERTSELQLLEHGTLRLAQTFRVPRHPRSLSIARERPLAAAGCIGGKIAVVDLESGEVTNLRPHSGIGRDDWISVDLSSNGRWLASSVNERLVLTRLPGGESAKLIDMAQREIEGPAWKSVMTNTIVAPAFAFVGDRLLVHDAAGVQNIDPEDVSLGDSGNTVDAEQPGAVYATASDPDPGIETAVAQASLADKRDALKAYHAPAVMLATSNLGESGWSEHDDGGPELGTTRFGGWPDLPHDVEWPTWCKRPMAFIAQVNLAQAHAVNAALCAPTSGLMSFFLGCVDDTYEKSGDPTERYMTDLLLGSEGEQADGWQVVFHDDISSLRRLRYEGSPLPELFDPCGCTISKGGKSLPDEGTCVYERLGLDDAQRDRYNELLTRVNPDNEDESAWSHQLLGYPMLIQCSPPELYCERASRGLDPYAIDDDEDVNAAALEWALILQLTSDGNPDFIWGDAGHLYFYGKRAAIEAGDFSQTWLYFEN